MLWTIVLLVALIGLAIYIRRTHGSVAALLARKGERVTGLKWSTVSKALFIATLVIWALVWLSARNESSRGLGQLLDQMQRGPAEATGEAPKRTTPD